QDGAVVYGGGRNRSGTRAERHHGPLDPRLWRHAHRRQPRDQPGQPLPFFPPGAQPPGPRTPHPPASFQGGWGPGPQVQATVKVPGVYGRACCKEVELRIRTTITRNSITGYELNCSVVSAGPYLTLVRWNGPLNNFTYIVRNATPCVNGDVLKLTAVGN